MMAALFFLSAVAGDESFAARFPPHAFPDGGRPRHVPLASG